MPKARWPKHSGDNTWKRECVGRCSASDDSCTCKYALSLYAVIFVLVAVII